jgi:hypothetical protein
VRVRVRVQRRVRRRVLKVRPFRNVDDPK